MGFWVGLVVGLVVGFVLGGIGMARFLMWYGKRSVAAMFGDVEVEEDEE